jgi:3-oxoacyl-[acyl-carrier protein] reductase
MGSDAPSRGALAGRAALVLGAVKGIGKAIALDLASAGARVAATHWDWEEALPDLRRDLAALGAEHLILRGDLRDGACAAQIVSEAAERFGGLQILINNIERGGWPVVHGPYTAEQWDLEQATTLRAKRWIFAAALPHLKASGDGCVVNLSSIAAIVGRSGPAAPVFNDGYAAASRAVSSLTETWARLGAPEVRVNELMLGLVATRHGPGTRGWGLLGAAQRRALLTHTLVRRLGTVEDVVRAVRFLLCDAPFMTGSVLRLDGGYVLGGEKVPPMPPGVL